MYVQAEPDGPALYVVYADDGKRTAQFETVEAADAYVAEHTAREVTLTRVERDALKGLAHWERERDRRFGNRGDSALVQLLLDIVSKWDNNQATEVEV